MDLSASAINCQNAAGLPFSIGQTIYKLSTPWGKGPLSMCGTSTALDARTRPVCSFHRAYCIYSFQEPGGTFDSNDSDNSTDSISSANILPSPGRIHSKIIEDGMNRWFLIAFPGDGAEQAHRDKRSVRQTEAECLALPSHGQTGAT